MTASYDTVIREGTIVDGSGGEPFIGSIAICGNQIAAIGDVKGRGVEEIDARGLMVTPGFVDMHTHYDGQVIWESVLSPSSNHGVTTALMGNCGVGFAPCRSGDRERLIELMEGVEDIPEVVMTEGLTWEWESYPEFLNVVEKRPHDINIASYLPHSPVRVYVMGERAKAREKATPADIARMAQVVYEGMQAGALGFSSSRTLFHRSKSGEIAPTQDAGEDELLAIAGAMRSAGHGLLQVASDYSSYTDVEGEFALLQRVAQTTGRPLSLPLAQMHNAPDSWRQLLGLIEKANARGANVTAQVMPRGIGLLFGLSLSLHPFMLTASYQAIQHLPLSERVALLRSPQLRARMTGEESVNPANPLQEQVRLFSNMFEVTDPLDYEPSGDRSIAVRAAQAGMTPAQFAYDLLVEHSDRAALFIPFLNYADGDLDVVMQLLSHRYVVPGLGDGGAHYGSICDASYSTFMLTHWTRDRSRGKRFTVPEVVQAMTSRVASVIGLQDRGRLAPGYKADVNVIDYANLQLRAPKVKYDLPAGGRRLTQAADGYVATLVNGKTISRSGVATGDLPGKLVRGPQSSPAAAKQAAAKQRRQRVG